MKTHPLVSCLGWIVLCEAVGSLGAIFTSSSVRSWYTGIEKPFLNPPSWIFGPVWTILYAMMGISIFLVLRSKKAKKEKKWLIQLFVAQLVLNFSWSIFFFGLQSPSFAFLNILFLLSIIIFLIFEYRKYSRASAWLLVPYALWVSFASYLNFMIWFLN
jgi:benzodiazapine receptor